MSVLSEEDVDALRRIADNIRSAAEVPGYGYFPGGDPRDFCPDPECCTEKEIEAHQRACALIESGEVQLVDGRHHWPVYGKDGEVMGWTTASPFGLGTYSLKDERLMRLARDLDEWVDAVRQEDVG